MVTLPGSSSGPQCGLFVDGKMRGTRCRFLIDTSVYYMIPKEQRPVLQTEGVQVRQVDGSPLAVLGYAWVEVQVGRTTHPVKAIFTEMKCSGILGMDFLLPTGGYLDFQTKEWKLNGERIRCTSSAGEPFVGRIVVAETTTIPSGHEALVPGIIKSVSDQRWLNLSWVEVTWQRKV